MTASVAANSETDIYIDYSSINGTILGAYFIGIAASYSTSDVTKALPTVSSSASYPDRVRIISTRAQTIYAYVGVLYKA